MCLRENPRKLVTPRGAGYALGVRPGPKDGWSFSLAAPVTLEGPGGVHGGLCRALGSDRLFVSTRQEYSPGSTVRVTLRDPAERTAMTLRARVLSAAPAQEGPGLWLAVEGCELDDNDLISAARHLHA